MSNAMAVTAVTAVLQTLLNQVYNHPTSVLGNVTVSAVAPDIVQTAVGAGSNAQLQVNLFLHHVTHNPAWRNVGFPSLGADGATATGNPPLALDLHYMLTAYAPHDGQAEALLTSAILLLHQSPTLPRATIRSALAALPVTSNYPTDFATAVSASGLADQVEVLQITPSTLTREEVAWLWTALRVDYRPSYPFQVSVVLVEPSIPVTSPLPVLQRSVSVQTGLQGALPALSAVAPPKGQPAAVLGDTVTVTGNSLSTVTGVQLTNAKLGVSQVVPPAAAPGVTGLSFTVPNPSLPAPQTNPTDLPAGVYALSAQAPSATTPPTTVASNSLPFAIAPHILPTWTPGTLASGTSVKVTAVPCAPYVRPGQEVFLLIGSQQAPADAFTAPTNAPSFTFATLLPTGQAVPVRLRVDGVDSPIIDMTQTPPVFTQPLVQVT